MNSWRTATSTANSIADAYEVDDHRVSVPLASGDTAWMSVVRRPARH
ncbi:hypothetical protein [Actinoplanes sp. CA-252034]